MIFNLAHDSFLAVLREFIYNFLWDDDVKGPETCGEFFYLGFEGHGLVVKCFLCLGSLLCVLVNQLSVNELISLQGLIIKNIQEIPAYRQAGFNSENSDTDNCLKLGFNRFISYINER